MSAGGLSVAARTLHNAHLCLKRYQDQKGFSRFLKGCEVVAAEPGKCSIALTVTQELANSAGMMHGGFGATLVDNITAMALLNENADSLNRLGVSVDMNVTYLNSARVGDHLTVTASAREVGEKMAFIDCAVTRKSDGALVISGKHTLFIG